ncbi:hypothetical protein AKJ64_01855 [candidate division MSBL1 archaeon SCGC-AAA259E17]|uniref:Uncharacterized protein n=1 Tax=candidate division MSBL1 archaeon SCGC-AAA259E17 TaxID=1698263 RepID=A0A133UFD6_9EURY|nr:hypothetical protein AKJ64_01855 [candidate division MSBL1 archaeon SCGC-AAA259E17]
MSYPLFIALSGIRLQNKSEVPNSVYAFEFGELKPLIKRTIKNVLRGLKGRRLGKLDREFLDEAFSLLAQLRAL